MPSPSAPPASPRSGGPPSSVPAYANAPRRSGLLIALAGIVALAAAAALAVFLFGATAPPMTAATKRSGDEAQQAMAAAKAALDEASKSVLQPSSGTAPAVESPAATPTAPAEPAKVEAPPASPPAPAAEAPKAEPAAPPPADKSRPVAKSEAPKTPQRTAAPAKAAPAAPEPARVAAAPAAVAAPEPAAPDRWDQMRAEMGQCSNGSLIPRIQCEQRIRTRYCDGYWGSVPACPTGRTDHGN